MKQYTAREFQLTYDSWAAMKGRLRRLTGKTARCYRDRGIVICERWMASFEAFIEDLGPRPAPEYTIDRIDNDGNYEPGNCRWATKKQQSANTRWARLITFEGETRTMTDWEEKLGLSRGTVLRRMRRGLATEDVLRPVEVRKPYRKLSQVEIEEIRASYRKGVPGSGCGALGKKYDVDATTVLEIVSEKRRERKVQR